MIHCCGFVCTFCFDLGHNYTVQTIAPFLVIVSVWLLVAKKSSLFGARSWDEGVADTNKSEHSTFALPPHFYITSDLPTFVLYFSLHKRTPLLLRYESLLRQGSMPLSFVILQKLAFLVKNFTHRHEKNSNDFSPSIVVITSRQPESIGIHYKLISLFDNRLVPGRLLRETS